MFSFVGADKTPLPALGSPPPLSLIEPLSRRHDAARARLRGGARERFVETPQPAKANRRTSRNAAPGAGSA